MYEQFYGFSALPFETKPAADSYYYSEQQRQILDGFEACINQGGSICVACGAEGVGKSTLVQSLCKRLKDKIDAYNVDVTCLSDEVSLQQEILLVLGVETTSDAESVITDQLISRLESLHRSGQRSLLVIDDADSLEEPDRQVLGSLVGIPDLQIMLIGRQLEPESMKARFSGISEDIVCRYTLVPLSSIETDAYIRARLAQAGGSQDVFTLPAIKAICHYSSGVPHLINHVCNLVLEYGFSSQSENLDKQKLDLMMSERWDASNQLVVSDFPVEDEKLSLVDATGNGAGGPWTEAGAGGDAGKFASKGLVKFLNQHENHDMQLSAAVIDDVYDFVRLSMQQQQRRLKRYMLILSGVVLVFMTGVTGIMVWKDSDLMPAALMQVTVPDRLPDAVLNHGLVSRENTPAVEQAVSELAPITRIQASMPNATPDAALSPGFVLHKDSTAVEQTEPKSVSVTRAQATMSDVVPGAKLNPGSASQENIPVVEQAALESATSTVIKMSESIETTEQKKLRMNIKVKNSALHNKSDNPAREHKLLEKKRVTQRTATRQLKRKMTPEERPVVDFIEQARKNAHMNWNKFNKAMPEAYSEDD